jgi:uncharacterized membrane protein HdeD (DUF308 family)
VGSTEENAEQRAAYWPVAVIRAVPLAGLALWITFSADHSATFGLLSFGVFGIVAGVVMGAAAWFRLTRSRARAFFVAQGAVTVAAGILALVFHTAGIQVFFFIVTVFAAVTGFLELYSGLRTRRRFVASTDWIAVGAFTAIAALVFLLIPPGFSQTFTGPDHVKRVLDSAVIAVGLLGAYAAIVAVYLVVAGLSAKWGTQAAPTEPTAEEHTEGEITA